MHRGDLLAGADGLLGGGEFDEVGENEMAWNKEVEDKARKDVLARVVVAADADENAILGECEPVHGKGGMLVFSGTHLLEVLDHKTQVSNDC